MWGSLFIQADFDIAGDPLIKGNNFDNVVWAHKCLNNFTDKTIAFQTPKFYFKLLSKKKINHKIQTELIEKKETNEINIKYINK